MIVIIVDELLDDNGLHKQLEYWTEHNQTLRIHKLSADDANTLLVQSSPPPSGHHGPGVANAYRHLSQTSLSGDMEDGGEGGEEDGETGGEMNMAGDGAWHEESSMGPYKVLPAEGVRGQSRTPSPVRPVFEGPIEK
jgi:hypothetical protein